MEVPPPQEEEQSEVGAASASSSSSACVVDNRPSQPNIDTVALEREESSEIVFLKREDGQVSAAEQLFFSYTEPEIQQEQQRLDTTTTTRENVVTSSLTLCNGVMDSNVSEASEEGESDDADEASTKRPIRTVVFGLDEPNGYSVDNDDAVSLVSSLSVDDTAAASNDCNNPRQDRDTSALGMTAGMDRNFEGDNDSVVVGDCEARSMTIWDAKNAISTVLSFPRPREAAAPNSNEAVPASEAAISNVASHPAANAALTHEPSPESPYANDETQRSDLVVAQVVLPPLPIAVTCSRSRDEERAEFARQVRREMELEAVRAEIVTPDQSVPMGSERPKHGRRTKIYCSIAIVVVALVAIASSVVSLRLRNGSASGNDNDRVGAPNRTADMTSTPSPSASPIVYSSKTGKQAFTNTLQLYDAVDAFLAVSTSESEDESILLESSVAIQYGYPIREWDVSRLTDFSRVFNANRDQKLEPNTRLMGYSSFNEDLSGWDVSRARSMYAMFAGAKDFVGTGLDMWNVSQVADFSFMFLGATSFNGNVTHWNTTSATTMQAMLKDATSFSGDISQFVTSNVESMAFMLYRTQVNVNLSRWDVTKVRNMDAMLAGTPFNGDISAWDVRNVENLQNMFADAHLFNGDLSSWRVDKVHNMAFMFSGATSFQGISSSNRSLSGWNTSRVTDMQKMFARCHLFQGNVSGFDVAQVTSFSQMFKECHLFDSDLSRWRTGLVTKMDAMFFDARMFSSQLSNWDTSRVKNMKQMFWHADAFHSDISAWNVSRVTDMTEMLAATASFRHNLCAWAPQLVIDLPSNMTSVDAAAPPRFRAIVDKMFNGSACEMTQDPRIEWNVSLGPVIVAGPFCSPCERW